MKEQFFYAVVFLAAFVKSKSAAVIFNFLFFSICIYKRHIYPVTTKSKILLEVND